MTTLRQQLVADRVASLVTAIGIPQDQAFERLVHSLVTGQSVHSMDPADWVDGGQDKQIDLISIDEEEREAEITIVSAKFTDTFSSNAIILMRNGLGWIFRRPRNEIDTISNESFREKILEIRSVVSGIGPSNITVRCYFATNGNSSGISPEYEQEARGILAEYDNRTFAEFSFSSLGADELVDLINKHERRTRSYATTALAQGQKIVSNEDVGQAFLAVALKKPGDARRRKYKVWTDNYAEIFSGSTAEPHVICVLLHQSAVRWAKTARQVDGISELKRKLISNGLLHISRIASFLWRGSDSFNQDTTALQQQIATLQTAPAAVNAHFDDALTRLEALIDANPDFRNDVDAALKAAILETAITRSLHTRTTSSAGGRGTKGGAARATAQRADH